METQFQQEQSRELNNAWSALYLSSLKYPILAGNLQERFKVYASKVNLLKDSYKTAILTASDEYILEQFAYLRSLGVDIPDDIDAIIDAQKEKSDSLYAQLFAGIPIWCTNTISTIQLNNLYLSSLQLKESEVRQALFGKGGDTASSFEKIDNSRKLNLTNIIWTVGGTAVSSIIDATNSKSSDTLMKMAMAVIDRRTTNCCLRVHGQIQPNNKPFILTGYPSFDSKMMQPPFHWNCRTSVITYVDRIIPLKEQQKNMRSLAISEQKSRKS